MLKNKTIVFSHIDAKEMPVLHTYDEIKTKANYKVLLQAQKEYLDKLYLLQQEIKAKHEPQLREELSVDIELDSEEADEIYQEVFGNWNSNPTHRDLYYT